MKKFFLLATCFGGLFANDQEVSINTPVHTSGYVLPTGAPNIENPTVNLSFEVFWGKSEIYGSEFAEKESRTTASQGGSIREYVHKYPSYDWAPGIVIGLGRDFTNYDMDLNLEFLYYNNSQGSSTNGSTRENIVVSRVNPAVPGNGPTFPFAQRATNTSKTQVYLLNAEMGKSYFVGRNTSFRTHFGGQFADISLNQTVQYSGLKSTTTSATDNGTLTAECKTKFYGVGPRVGVDIRQYMNNDFYFFTTPAVALLSGNFAVDMFQQYSSSQGSYKDMARFDRITPTAGANFGLGYSRFLFDNAAYLSVQFGYDIEYFFNQSIRYNMTNTLNEMIYDFSLQSYFLSVSVNL